MNKILIIILVILFILYLVFYKITGFAVPCPFHALTSFYCPGCGITRMFTSILTLDFYEAFRYNSLVFILLILAIIFSIIKFISLKLNKENFFTRKISDKIWITILVIVIIYGILRNIFPFLGPNI